MKRVPLSERARSSQPGELRALLRPHPSALTSSRRQEKFSVDAGGRGGYVPGKEGGDCGYGQSSLQARGAAWG